MLTVAAVAERLQVQESTVRSWLRSGRLKGIRLGDRAGWRVEREELVRFIAEQRGSYTVDERPDE